MDPITGPVPVIRPDVGEVTEPEQVNDAAHAEGLTQPDTIPDLEGSDLAQSCVEESNETANFPNMQPLYVMSVKTPSVKQQRETTRSRLALIIAALAMLTPIVLVLWHVTGDDLKVVGRVATIALIVVLTFYFRRPPRRRKAKRSRS